VDPANVIHLQVDDAWHRLYMDGATVFWRPGEAPPSTTQQLDQGSFKYVDVGAEAGLDRQAISQIEYGGSDVSIYVCVKFSNGSNATITHPVQSEATAFSIEQLIL